MLIKLNSQAHEFVPQIRDCPQRGRAHGPTCMLVTVHASLPSKKHRRRVGLRGSLPPGSARRQPRPLLPLAPSG